jgi:hypothetical protein
VGKEKEAGKERKVGTERKEERDQGMCEIDKASSWGE